jgi:transposase
MTRAGTTEQRAAMHARTILRAAESAARVTIADELDVSVPTVLLWRRRFRERGLAGLADAPHPGRPRVHGCEVREGILAETLTRPAGTNHWPVGSSGALHRPRLRVSSGPYR